MALKEIRCPKCGFEQKVHASVCYAEHHCNPNTNKTYIMETKDGEKVNHCPIK